VPLLAFTGDKGHGAISSLAPPFFAVNSFGNIGHDNDAPINTRATAPG
jgi:hypothetical protein